MKFRPHPSYFNSTGHYVSGPYSIHNMGKNHWEVYLYDEKIDVGRSFRSAKSIVEKHYNAGGLAQ